MEFLQSLGSYLILFGIISYVVFGILFKEEVKKNYGAVKNNKKKYSYGNLKAWLLKF